MLEWFPVLVSPTWCAVGVWGGRVLLFQKVTAIVVEKPGIAKDPTLNSLVSSCATVAAISPASWRVLKVYAVIAEIRHIGHPRVGSGKKLSTRHMLVFFEILFFKGVGGCNSWVDCFLCDIRFGISEKNSFDFLIFSENFIWNFFWKKVFRKIRYSDTHLLSAIGS